MATVDMDLAGRLQTARKRLPELTATVDQCDRQVRTLQADLSAAQAEVKTEAETALIEGRSENVKVLAAIAPTEEKLKGALARAATARGAVERQRAIIESLQGEINQHAHRRALEAALPVFAEIRERISDLRSLALDFRSACGGLLSTLDVINQTDPAASYDLAILREILAQIGMLAHDYTDWRAALHIKKAA